MSEPDLVRAVRSGLGALADPVLAPDMQRYMKSVLPFYGVKAPAVRALTRDLVAAHPLTSHAQWQAVIRTLYDQATHREERYAALGIAGHRTYQVYRNPASLALYRHLAVAGAWWDLVDTVASQVGEVLQRHREATEPVLREWAMAEDLWLRRVAILAQLKHRDQTDTALLDAALTANLDESDFFIRKAIGWALREYAKTDPGWVRGFVRRHRDELSPLSLREALKHLGG